MKINIALFLLAFSVLSHASTADKITVSKSEKLLYLQKDGKVFAAYSVTFGRNPIGQKLKVGDNRTPEGIYLIDAKKENSAYFKALHISYPNPTEIEQAKISGVDPEGDIIVHGPKMVLLERLSSSNSSIRRKVV